MKNGNRRNSTIKVTITPVKVPNKNNFITLLGITYFMPVRRNEYHTKCQYLRPRKGPIVLTEIVYSWEYDNTIPLHSQWYKRVDVTQGKWYHYLVGRENPLTAFK
jgi:hypothetical protein